MTKYKALTRNQVGRLLIGTVPDRDWAADYIVTLMVTGDSVTVQFPPEVVPEAPPKARK